jgi:hypothetical protein
VRHRLGVPRVCQPEVEGSQWWNTSFARIVAVRDNLIVTMPRFETAGAPRFVSCVNAVTLQLCGPSFPVQQGSRQAPG